MLEPSWANIAMAESEKAFRLEIDSSERLSEKAEKYLGAAVLAVGLPFLGGISVPSLDALTALHRMMLIIAAALFSVGICLSLLAMRTHRYKSYPPERKLIEILQAASVDGLGAQLQMTGIYLDARAANRIINARRATLLGWSALLLVLGFATLVAFQLTQFLS